MNLSNRQRINSSRKAKIKLLKKVEQLILKLIQGKFQENYDTQNMSK